MTLSPLVAIDELDVTIPSTRRTLDVAHTTYLKVGFYISVLS